MRDNTIESEFSDIRTAFLISGGGTTMEAAVNACGTGEITGISPVLVIASRRDAGGIERSRRLDIPVVVIPRDELKKAQYAEELFNALRLHGVDFISQNGLIPLTPLNVVEEYKGNIINQHPGDIVGNEESAFGGPGMWGSHVTAATLIYHALVGTQNPTTSSTIHHVSPKLDEGNLINYVSMDIPVLGRSVTIADFQTLDPYRRWVMENTIAVQKQLLPIEHQNVIRVLKMVGEGRELPRFIRPGLIPQAHYEILGAAKRLGIEICPNN